MSPELKVIKILRPLYTAKGMVDLGNPEDTLIATLLSARTRDEQVMRVYPVLRNKFPSLLDLAQARETDIAHAISTIGLYRNKAKSIKALAQMLMHEFDGRVPQTMEELTRLPGVGRKTASCVLWYGFKKPAMAVDTHVFRITRRLGWAKGENPMYVEQELCARLPSRVWGDVNRIFVQFGRAICKPGRPCCQACPVRHMCAYGQRKKQVQ